MLMVVEYRGLCTWALAGVIHQAPVTLFRINSVTDDSHYYRNAIKDNLSLVVVLEFVIAFYGFDLWVELLIVPVTARKG